MSKTKTKALEADLEADQPTPEPSPEGDEFARVQESRNMLMSALDWCGEHDALVCWGKAGSGRAQLRVRVEDLQVECDFSDPIEGFLEGVELMQARLARKAVNLGL